jgi:hypothetical protein
MKKCKTCAKRSNKGTPVYDGSCIDCLRAEVARLEAELKKRDQEIRCVAHGCDPPYPNDECRRLKCDRIIEQESGRAKPDGNVTPSDVSGGVNTDTSGPETPAHNKKTGDGKDR